MYQEEELKRLLYERKATYGQVKFDYNSQPFMNTSEENFDSEQVKVEEPEKPYVQPRNLNIPYSVLLPETMNQHIIIEKTARFISGQGPQMEILIKAKQSNNPKFEFLTQSNKFNPYYKFILNSIKDGTYPSAEDVSSEVSNIMDKVTDSRNILSNADSKSTSLNEPIVPNIPYKPSPNCAYTQLISKIKGVPLPEVLSNINSNSKKLEQELDAKVVPCEKQSEDRNYGTVEIKNISSGLMLAQAYASDSDNESENHDISSKNESKDCDSNFGAPPEHIQTVIDKTATYVVKNGKQFEETLKLKGDERFMFLNEKNEYYPYYMNKLLELYSLLPPQSKKKRITPVSFSIKSKDETSMPIKPVLPQEGSDDESQQKTDNQNEHNHAIGNNQHNSNDLPENVKRAIQLVENQLVARNNVQSLLSKTTCPYTSNNKAALDNAISSKNIPPSSLTNCTTSLNQRNTVDKQKELKLAEEKIKDRLAQIAREKLGLISKEKQLQLERKKKAIAFLNHIKDCNNSSALSKLKEESSNSDNDSVHSIPISSYETNEMEKNPPNIYQSKPSFSYEKKDHNNDDSDVISSSSVDSENAKFLKRKEQYSPHHTNSRSRSPSHKRKKSKHHHRHHSKRKSKKRARSRSNSKQRSITPSLDRRKRHRSISSKKSKKHKREKIF
ncbi:protein suppressor of white apricot isoform X2 [Condylostylus longicornis]|nr:protein suppressor of white apricot isoform X2 [Condylostylus longicornis]XP_055388611.1 protein suppressor of white apricot isoform X2 [Condylostylus longicornis]XP_055388612.1 protein suppressor of white apricot isoform X2 [Condylostylus longicornis]